MDCCGLEAAGRLAIMVSGILPMETVLGGWLVCVCVGYYVSKRVCVCVWPILEITRSVLKHLWGKYHY